MGFSYEFMKANLLINLEIELLLLTIVLVDFGAILTNNIYSK